MRIHQPSKMSYTELFRRGHAFNIRQWTECAKDKKRIIQFYQHTRIDGLFRREEYYGEKIEDYFCGRLDGLCVRTAFVRPLVAGDGEGDRRRQMSYTVLPGESGDEDDVVITKMIERFERCDKSSPLEEINSSDGDTVLSKRTYHIQENKIILEYNQLPSGLLKKIVKINKDRSSLSSSLKEKIDDDDDVVDEKTLHEVLHAERECLAAVRGMHQDTIDAVRLRKSEEKNVQFERSTLDIVREEATVNQTAVGGVSENRKRFDYNEKNDNISTSSTSIDYLSPYLKDFLDVNNMSMADAKKVHDNFLQTQKTRLLERANVLRHRLEQEHAKLEEFRMEYDKRKNSEDKSSENSNQTIQEEFEKKCIGTQFRLKITQKRLEKHEKSFSARYKALEDKIGSDPRMKILKCEK